MAEIKIEKKKPVWPWILGFIIMLALVAYFVYQNNINDEYPDDVNSEEIYKKDTDTIYNRNSYQDTSSSTDSKSSMMDYSESISDSTRIGTDSTYTKTALYYLSNVVIATAAQYNLENSIALENLKQFASQEVGMSTSNMSERTAIFKNIKPVSNNIVTVLESIQTRSFPSLQKEVAILKETSNKLTIGNIENEKTELQAFFRKAKEVLNIMNS